MKTLKKIAFTLIVAALIAVLTACGGNTATDKDYCDDMDLLHQVLEFIESRYITGLDIDEADVLAAQAVVFGLDDFSNLYLAALSGNETPGIGISLYITKYNEYFINTIYDNTPATFEFEDGFKLERGDEVYAIDGERVAGLSVSEFSEMAKGEENEKMRLTIRRNGVILPQEREYTRKTFTTANCFYVNDLGEGISSDLGYIRLTSFTTGADKEFALAIERWKADSNEGLILDLRNNPGGSSTVLSKIAAYCIDLKTKFSLPILNLQYKENGVIKSLDVTVNDRDKYIDAPIYVLCNENTASASEALIGAIRAYNDTGYIIGQKTYGKGVCQNSPIEITDDYNGARFTYRIAVVMGYYYIYDESVEGGKYNIHQNPLVPDYELEPSAVMGELRCDTEIIKANELFSAR